MDATHCRAVGVDGPRIANYMGVRMQFKRTVDGVTYIVLLYAAYNAFGLIGSEKNGIAILNDTAKYVVTDEICRIGFSWGGADAAQVAEMCTLEVLTDDDFLSYIRKSSNFRGDHTLTTGN